jgi:hypothetical protein
MVFTIADLLNQWGDIGVFDYVLPFLLVFAIIYGILSTIKIFGDKKVHIIIALVLGLLSLQWGYLSQFLNELAPRLGIGVSVLLAVMILAGMFIAKEEVKYWARGLAALGVIIAIVIFVNTSDNLGYGNFNFTSETMGWLIGALLLIGIIIALVTSTSEPDPSPGRTFGPWQGGSGK